MTVTVSVKNNVTLDKNMFVNVGSGHGTAIYGNNIFSVHVYICQTKLYMPNISLKYHF